MTVLNYLLQDMHKLETALSPFEERFGVLSEDFYTAIMRGDLEEFDALDEDETALVLDVLNVPTDERFVNVTATFGIGTPFPSRTFALRVIDAFVCATFWEGVS